MLKRIKMVNEVTNQVLVMGENSDENWAVENGFSKELVEVERAYNGLYYIAGYAPSPTIEEQNEVIRATREELYDSAPCVSYKYDYEEAVARYGQDSEEALATSALWIAEKDKIRAENPYLEA